MYTTDPKDPDLGRGGDLEPIPQHKKYLVLSDEELAKGFIRPVREVYIHAGEKGPEYPLRDPDAEMASRGYVKYEEYPKDETRGSTVGRYWTQAQLDNVNKGCGSETRMGLKLCETYAREPHFYGYTYCVRCQKHLPVSEFRWLDGTTVGS